MLDAEFGGEEPVELRHIRPSTTVTDQLEVSWAFSAENAAQFLWRLAPLLKDDFSSDRIHELIRALDSLKLEEASEQSSFVTFRGRRIAMKIAFYRYEPSMIGVYVTTGWALARAVEDEMKKFQAEIEGQSLAGEEARADHARVRGNLPEIISPE